MKPHMVALKAAGFLLTALTIGTTAVLNAAEISLESAKTAAQAWIDLGYSMDCLRGKSAAEGETLESDGAKMHVVSLDDGYSGETLYTHINLGWSGEDNVWYALPNIVTSDGKLTATRVDSAIYNIFPSSSGEIVSGRVLAGPSIEQGDDGAVRVWAFVYFPPKPGKFAGYGNEWCMEWNGKEFERVE